MKELNPIIIEMCIGHLPEFVIQVLNKYPGVCVAGGFIRACVNDEKIADIDLWVHNRDTAEAIKIWFLKEYCGQGLLEVHKCSVTETANAISLHGLGVPIQIITRWMYNNPVSVVNDFDFTIAQAGIYFSMDQMGFVGVCADTFMEDCKLKQLVYTTPQRNEDCAGSLCRVLKFTKRGYSCGAKNLSAVIARLAYKTYKEYSLNECTDEVKVGECLHREIAKANGRRY